MGYKFEKLSEDITVCVGDDHRFGTDAILLADYCNAKRGDIVCDLGTGCGIIPLAIKRNYNPKLIYGVDIQEEAIKQFSIGIEHSNIEDKDSIKPVCADLKEVATRIPKAMFDVVTCNPPYKLNNTGIKSSVTAQMIARHEILCTIDDVCVTAGQLLKFGGKLCLCQRPERLTDVLEAMRKANIEPKRLKFVSKNMSTAPWLFLVEGKKGSKPFLQVEKPLYMYDMNGNYTDETKKLYRF